MFKFSAIIGATMTLASPAIAGDFNPKLLSPAEDKRWVSAIESHVTGDGATVRQVWQFAETMRPREFKHVATEVGYDGATGEPDGVMVCYWIGMKRLDGDAYCGPLYDIRRDGNNLKVTPAGSDIDAATKAMEGGRDTFLAYIHAQYEEICIGHDTKERFC